MKKSTVKRTGERGVGKTLASAGWFGSNDEREFLDKWGAGTDIYVQRNALVKREESHPGKGKIMKSSPF